MFIPKKLATNPVPQAGTPLAVKPQWTQPAAGVQTPKPLQPSLAQAMGGTQPMVASPGGLMNTDYMNSVLDQWKQNNRGAQQAAPEMNTYLNQGAPMSQLVMQGKRGLYMPYGGLSEDAIKKSLANTKTTATQNKFPNRWGY